MKEFYLPVAKNWIKTNAVTNLRQFFCHAAKNEF